MNPHIEDSSLKSRMTSSITPTTLLHTWEEIPGMNTIVRGLVCLNLLNEHNLIEK
jgi:hypothetical protein